MSNEAPAIAREPAGAAGPAAAAGGPSLKRKVYGGAAWTVFGFGAGTALRVVGSMVLSRILTPQAMGMMGLLNSITTGFNLLTDIGVGYSIVKDERGAEREFLDTAWTLQALRGAALWGLMAALAWPLQWAYQKPGQPPMDPPLAWLLVAMGFQLALGSLASTRLIVLRRELDTRGFVLVQVAEQAIYLTAAVLLALRLRSVWAYIFAGWLGTAFRVAVSHYLNRHAPNRPRLDRSACRRMMRFGRWVLLSTMLSFLAMQADRLMLPGLIPLGVFGAYMIATNLVDLPKTLLNQLTAWIVFPALSRRADLPRAEMRAKVTRHRRKALLAMAAGVAATVGTGDLLIRLLYDPRFHQAAWMLPLLTLGLWPRVIATTVDGALKAIGVLHYEAIGNALRLAIVVLGLPVANRHLGLVGVVGLMASCDLFALLPGLYGRWRHGLSTTRQDLLATGAMLLMLCLILAARAAAGLGMPWDGLFEAAAAPPAPGGPR
jgi:O-antigen/teichoic acid export membrane protein